MGHFFSGSCIILLASIVMGRFVGMPWYGSLIAGTIGVAIYTTL